MQGNILQNISKTSTSETMDSFSHHARDWRRNSAPISDTPSKTATVGETNCGHVKYTLNVDDNIQTYQSKRNATVVITIITDQLATANICNLRFLGIFAGTKLVQWNHTLQYKYAYKINGNTNLTFAWRAAIGLIGVVVSFERRSLSDEAERLREPEDSFGFGWICDIAAQRIRAQKPRGLRGKWKR